MENKLSVQKKIGSGRNDSISIAKGIGIILMVIGHTRMGFIHYFIYYFHMPLFFLISGYFFKEIYLYNKIEFFKKRINGTYKPFVKWGFLFLIFHNVFYKLNIYSSVYGFENCVSSFYSIKEYIFNGLGVLKMSHTEQLIGTYWFLHDLFFSSLISLILCFTLSKFRFFDFEIKIIFLIIICLITSIIFCTRNIFLPLGINARLFLVNAFYLSGYIYNRFENRIVYSFRGFLLSFVSLILITVYLKPISMSTLNGNNIILYFLIAFVGIYFVFNLSYRLELFKYKNIIIYIGENTLYILTFHLLSFKLVSLIYVFIENLPIEYISKFPVIYTQDSYMWIIYTFVGVTIPLIFKEFLVYIEVLVKQKLSYVKKYL